MTPPCQVILVKSRDRVTFGVTEARVELAPAQMTLETAYGRSNRPTAPSVSFIALVKGSRRVQISGDCWSPFNSGACRAREIFSEGRNTGRSSLELMPSSLNRRAAVNTRVSREPTASL